jgi:sugar/nucleoside kinase (ribokinase family)
MDATLFGLIVADIIAQPMGLRPPPAPGGLQIVNSVSLTTGGNVCNTGLAMAKLGMKVAAAGMVGRDVLGAAVLENLQKGGMDTSAVIITEQAQTSATVVAVEAGGERCFFHSPGATPLLDAKAFRQCMPMFKRSRFVQIGYFGLLPTITPDLAGLLGELKAGAPLTKIALDTVNPPAAAELLWPILRHVDIFAPSRTEAAALTGENEPRQMVRALRRHMPGGLIGIKLDVDGCYLDDGSRAVQVPACRIEVVDTTGAGDTWFGAMLTALAHNMPLEQGGKFANRAAADCCTALGASAGVRSFEETMARI